MGQPARKVIPLEGEGRRVGKGTEAFVTALAAGLSVAEAAKAAGVSRSTGYRRRENPEIQALVEKARAEDLGQNIGRLISATGKSLEVLTALLDSESAHIRLAAAKTILTTGGRLIKADSQSSQVKHDERVGGQVGSVDLSWDEQP